jgi:6-phosphogluconolactonase
MPNNFYKLNRRRFLKQLGFSAAAFPFVRLATAAPAQLNRERQLLYIGTYTTGTASEGIYIHHLDVKTGALSPYKTVKGVSDPSFLAVDRQARLLFAVNETLEYNSMKSGSVSAFSIERQTGELTLLNKQPSMGGAPCHISVSRNNRFVLVANYVGGNISVLPIDRNGKLQPSVEIKQHEGTGPNKERQESAHAHWVDLDMRGRIAAACDLGSDKVFLYRFDEHSGKLFPNSAQAFFQTKPGAGPRHFVFHPNGKFAYVINELNCTVTALRFDRGRLNEIQTVSTLPANWSGENTCAELQLSPDGNFLYGSNRGHDSIVSYSVDHAAGKLSLIEHVSTGGKTPRNFVIDPTGTILLAANQKSDSIVSFAIDGKTGRLHSTGSKCSVPSPVCLKLIPVVR